MTDLTALSMTALDIRMGNVWGYLEPISLNLSFKEATTASSGMETVFTTHTEKKLFSTSASHNALVEHSRVNGYLG
jgi:hypothetical protein